MGYIAVLQQSIPKTTTTLQAYILDSNDKVVSVNNVADLIQLYAKDGVVAVKAYIAADSPSYQLIVKDADRVIAIVKQVKADAPATYKQIDPWIQELEEQGYERFSVDLSDPLFKAVTAFKLQRAETVRAAMKKQKVKMAQLAHAANVPSPMVTYVIDGDRRNEGVEATICSELDLDIAEVFPASIQDHVQT